MVNKYFKSNLIIINNQYASREKCIADMAIKLEKFNYAKNAKKVYHLALEREKQFSTAIGNKIAIPHICDDVMNEPVIFYAKIKQINWGNSDELVENVFFICMNKTSGQNSHMDVLQNLSKMFLKQSFLDELNTVKSYDNLINLFKKNQEEIITIISDNQQKYDVVAITSCPTGVAHTYLAAESLVKTAKDMNIKIKVETQGTEGQRNTLTQCEINEAKGVILALDRSIDESRFAGKENVVECSTRAVIKNAKEQIDKVIQFKGNKKNGSVSQQTKFEDNTNLMSFKNFGRRIYQAIMNGVSHMLPFVIFGGIFIAIAFMIDAFANPNAGGDFGEANDVSRWFKGIGGIAFGLIVAILAAYMVFALVGKGGLLPGFLVGMMANGAFTNDGKPWLMPNAAQLGNIVSDDQIAAGSGFFGAIGGALIAAALYILITNYILNKLPKSFNAIKNILLMPLFGTAVIIVVFFFANIPLQFINILFGALLNTFGNQPELYPLLGIIMGLMMAADLGGPINKAAYIFGTITLANSPGSPSVPMAIAMGAGMVPPLAIALSVTFNKKNWTNDQIKLGYSNYLMAASFISEGAIPFTAQQPKKMVIANLAGGAVTGILIGSLRIGVSAPHGGLFVAPLYRTLFFEQVEVSIGVGITFFLASVLVGAIIEAIIIWALSKYTKFGKNPELQNQVNMTK